MGRDSWGRRGPECARSRASLGVLFFAALLVGCGDPAPTTPARTPPPETPARPVSGYRVISLAAGSTGRIEGRCALERAVEPVEIRPGMGVDGPVPSENAQTGAGLGLLNCVVYLASIAEGKDWPEALRAEDRTAWIRILPGRYEPRVQWTRLETQLALESRIPMDLNVHGFQGATRVETIFNLSVSPGAKLSDTAELWLRRPGLVFVTDDFRGGFQAYVHVSTHPYVDVTGAEAVPGRAAGSFRLDDVPAGTYEVVCWHEGLSPSIAGDERRPFYGAGPEIRLSRTVRVTAGGTTVADFVVPTPPATPR